MGHEPSRQCPSRPRPAWQHHYGQVLADRSADAHADEQSRSGRGGEAARAGGVWRHRPGGAGLGELRPDRGDAAAAGGGRDAAGAIGQAGGGVPDACGCAAGADRELEPGAALGDLGAFQRARSARADDVRADDRRVVDLYRQPRDRAGDVRDLRRGGAAALRRRPGGAVDPDGGAGRHGRGAAAGGDDGGGLPAGGGVPSKPDRDAAAHAVSGPAGGRSGRGAGDYCAGVPGAAGGFGRAAWECGRGVSGAGAAGRAAGYRDGPDERA